MKVLTLKSLEEVPSETQLDIHYGFRMEHHTDYVFRDKKASTYSSTISVEDPDPVLKIIVGNSRSFPDLTFTVDIVNMEDSQAVRKVIKKGEILEEKKGSWIWA